MGPFVVHKVVGFYGQRVTIKGLDGLSEQGRWAQPCNIHAIYLALFNEPYAKPHEFTLEALEVALTPD